MTQKAILFGPFVGELFWEFFRFAPILSYYRKVKYRNQDIKYIVLTREDRFDIYGCFADIFVPLKIEGDYVDKVPNSYRLDNFSIEKYLELAKIYNDKYKKQYKIIEHLYPKLHKSHFYDKRQYSINTMLFEYKPRPENYKLVNEYLPDDKPIVIIAPRYRNGSKMMKRNWGGWLQFYDILENNKKLLEKFNFVICGKEGQYIKDPKDRFYDINKIQLSEKSSLFGLLFATMERAFFTFGSQSAIPNISLICGVEALEFGHQEHLHTVVYNIKKTPVTFIQNPRYNIEPKIIFQEFKNILLKKEKRNDGMGTFKQKRTRKN